MLAKSGRDIRQEAFQAFFAKPKIDRQKLTFAKLKAFTCLRLTVFFTLNNSRITR